MALSLKKKCRSFDWQSNGHCCFQCWGPRGTLWNNLSLLTDQSKVKWMWARKKWAKGMAWVLSIHMLMLLRKLTRMSHLYSDWCYSMYFSDAPFRIHWLMSHPWVTKVTSGDSSYTSLGRVFVWCEGIQASEALSREMYSSPLTGEADR